MKLKIKLQLQPIGEVDRETLNILASRLKTIFGIVEILEPIPLMKSAFNSHRNQYLSDDFLKEVKHISSEYILGVTEVDLYTHNLNFVFGQASLIDRVGVFSFARYDPLFYGQRRSEYYKKVLLLRSCKVLAHETGHMFGLYHCIFYQCCLNGSNHLKESDSRPILLCPVCLRKLYYTIGFDIYHHYRRLFQLYEKVGFKNQTQWIGNRMVNISKL